MKYLTIFEDFSNDTIKNEIRSGLLDGKYSLVKSLLKDSTEYIDRYSPPELAEKTYNLTGISHRYIIPFGFSEQEMETISNEFMSDIEVMNLIFKELLKLNPILSILKNVPVKNEEFGYPKSAVIGGACSRMNPDDMYDYIHSGTEIELVPRQNNGEYKFIRKYDLDEYSLVYNGLLKKGIDFNYFPSISTMKNIEGQLLIGYGRFL